MFKLLDFENVSIFLFNRTNLLNKKQPKIKSTKPNLQQLKMLQRLLLQMIRKVQKIRKKQPKRSRKVVSIRKLYVYF